MRLKTILPILFLFCNIVLSNAQSKEILVKSAMLNAEEAYNNENYSECFSYLKEAETTLGKTDSRIQYLKVKTLMAIGSQDQNNIGMWKLAEAELKIYFEITPENETIAEKFDEMVMAVSKIKKRIDLPNEIEVRRLTEVINKEPSNADAYYSRGEAKYRLRDYQGSVRDFTKTIEIAPESDKAFYSRGVSNFYLKDYKNAIPDFSKAIQITNDEYTQVVSFYYLSIIHSLANNKTEAIKNLTIALERGYNIDWVQTEYLDNIKNSPEFKELIKKYTE